MNLKKESNPFNNNKKIAKPAPEIFKNKFESKELSLYTIDNIVTIMLAIKVVDDILNIKLLSEP